MLDGAMTSDADRDQVNEAPGERLVDVRIPVVRGTYAIRPGGFRAGVGSRACDLFESVVEGIVDHLFACLQLAGQGIQAVGQIVSAEMCHARSGSRQYLAEISQRTLYRDGVPDQFRQAVSIHLEGHLHKAHMSGQDKQGRPEQPAARSGRARGSGAHAARP